MTARDTRDDVAGAGAPRAASPAVAPGAASANDEAPHDTMPGASATDEVRHDTTPGSVRGSLPHGALRWRCRRGLKELDVLLTRYVDEVYPSASPAHQEAFRELLDAQDPLVYAYCLGQQAPAHAALRAVVERITAASSNHP